MSVINYGGIHPFLINYPFREVVGAYTAGPIRLYCHIRAHILRNRILREVGQYVPFAGSVAELGCGFGLFANCFAMTRPQTTFTCCDLSAGRIEEANRVANRLALPNITFQAEDAITFLEKLPPQDCIYMLDLVHHLPPEAVDQFLSDVWDHVNSGGLLLVKDVADKPFPKMAFTWLLDVAMTKGEVPNYLAPERFIQLLARGAASISVHYLDDYLPYPHVLYVARKA